MGVSRQLRSEIGRRIPRKLGAIPYTLSIELLSRGARILSLARGAPKLEIWSRNSFRLGTFTPLLSDLDLTLWFEAPPKRTEIQRVLAAFKLFRLTAPWIGELNLYAEEDAHAFAPIANPLELARDPELRSRLRQEHREAEAAERAAFLFRMLEADYENLSKRPAARGAKWRAHLDAAGLRAVHELSVPGVLEGILRLAGIGGREIEKTRAELQALMEHRAEGNFDALKLPSDAQWAFGCNRIPYRHAEARELAPIYQLVLSAQMRWEVWGLLSQFRLIPDRDGLLRHLDSLAQLQAVCAPGSAETATALARFAELVARESAR